jgi:hypothetical protein
VIIHAERIERLLLAEGMLSRISVTDSKRLPGYG